LERSLILALQILECCEKTVVCVNLIDEAKRHGLSVDAQKLSAQLSAPVVLTAAGRGEGLDSLLEQVRKTSKQQPQGSRQEWGDQVIAAGEIARLCVSASGTDTADFRRRVDRLLVSRRFGVPLMLILFLGIVWLTVWGANYPSALLESIFNMGYVCLSRWLSVLPWWLKGVLVDGLYATCARVIAVMLPPMAIFFPLFTILEDVGYLPRMAFLLDPCMARCGGCGKQALTLCMGLGCNAVGVMGCRIIDSPRERLSAILTNAMVPCNGRFPTLILLGSLFFPDAGAALVVAFCVALGVVGAMGISGLLSKTVLRSEPSTFLMEMPPFRRPRLGKILVRSLLDRTLFVAGRALTVAAPAGVVLWVLANTQLLGALAGILEPAGLLLGMNGVILLGFILSLPANELLIPVILMATTQAQSLQSVAGVGEGLLLSAMTWQTAVCTMVYTLFHWPCSTTLLTVYKETGSITKTAAALLLPTAVGCILCIGLNLLL
jgi:ferrous iron transport protein B